LAKIIALANQKGGVGKTTTAVNLAAYLAQADRQTLIVDLDPQGNTTSGLGIDKEKISGRSLYEAMLQEATLSDIILSGPLNNLMIVPSTKKLVGAEVELVSSSERDTVLDQLFKKHHSNYDYVIIDCPPSLSLLTVNGLNAADSVIIPVQCEYYAMEGISSLLETIELVRECLNNQLLIEGVLLTMYDVRTNLSEQVAKEVRSYFGDLVFQTVIPRNVRLGEAPSHGLPISLYDAASKGAQTYQELAREILTRET